MVATEHADVILRDGRTLRLRPPGRDDADALLAFFGGLSQRSLYLRFHGFPEVSPRLVESLARAGLAGARRAARRARRRGGRAGRRRRQLRSPARPEARRGGLRRRRRASGPRHRHASARAAGRARGRGRNRALRRLRAAGQPCHAGRLRGGRLRADARARERRARGAVPDRADRDATASTSTPATTRRSSRRCDPSSSRGASP